MQSELRLLEHTPRFDIAAAASLTEQVYGLHATAIPLSSERDQNFLLTNNIGNKFVLKIANSLEDRALLEAQNQLLTHLANRLSFCPRLVDTLSGQQMAETKSPDGEINFIRLVTYLPGLPLAEVSPHSHELLFDFGKKLGQLDRELADFDSPAVHRDFHWDLANGPRVISEYGTLIENRNLRKLVCHYAKDFERDLGPLLPRLRRSVIHNDANDYNVLVDNDNVVGQNKVVGLIDFGDLVYSYTASDLAVAIAYVVLDNPSPIAAAVPLVAGYMAENPLSDDEIHALYGLAMMRLCMSACLSAYQKLQQPENKYLEISQRAIIDKLPRLATIDTRMAAAAFRAARGFPATSNKTGTLALRQRLLGSNLKLAYKDPLKIVRGWMQYLYDNEGRQYTDAYNNVAHVGHCHPKIVRAGQDQMALLNTNTRYLHDQINAFAERLTSTLPAPLSVCFFVNSGSEANELALRLARAYTRARDLIVLEHAYHGNTTTLIDISPYKHDGPGGCGAPLWVHKVPLPDLYRGRYQKTDEFAVDKYVGHVQDVIQQLRGGEVRLAGFISESLPSVAGQIVFPDGYLAKVYTAVREVGGVCIADEVQTAYGRIGTHFWGFESYGVVPDIVVLGKPIGNGHPIGAVVTTPEIAAAFDNGMEFFSTFGGNTVSCAIGLAVLNLVFEENMQSHALRVGERIIHGLQALMDRHEIIGDIRGSGFFLGVELVRSRDDLEPASSEADLVVNRLRAQGILLGTDGPFHNVLKIRPPLPFSADDADQLIVELDRILATLAGS